MGFGLGLMGMFMGRWDESLRERGTEGGRVCYMFIMV